MQPSTYQILPCIIVKIITSVILDAYVLVISDRGGSMAAATSKMECFVIIVNGFQPLTIITKHSILDVATALYSPLSEINKTH